MLKIKYQIITVNMEIFSYKKTQTLITNLYHINA